MGTSISLVAVFDTYMDRNPVAINMPSTIRRGAAPTRFNTMKAIRRWRSNFSCNGDEESADEEKTMDLAYNVVVSLSGAEGASWSGGT